MHSYIKTKYETDIILLTCEAGHTGDLLYCAILPTAECPELGTVQFVVLESSEVVV